MNKVSQEELNKMKHLISFKNSDNVSVINNKPIVEFKTKAADGKTYGIVREYNKFYIKVAPKKDTEVLAEDFEYIGGINARKDYEYNSYALASKQLDLKLMSINEAHASQSRIIVETPKIVDAEWQIAETKEMRREIDRIKQISNNVSTILNENSVKNNFTQDHTLPEAPSKNPSEKAVNSPYIYKKNANGDKEFRDTETDYENAGSPFDIDGEIGSDDMQTDKMRKGKGDRAVYVEKTKYAPYNAIANKKAKGAKPVKMNEDGNRRCVKLTMEQAKAWAKANNFISEDDDSVTSNMDYTTELPFSDVNEGYYDYGYEDDYDNDAVDSFLNDPKNRLSDDDMYNDKAGRYAKSDIDFDTDDEYDDKWERDRAEDDMTDDDITDEGVYYDIDLDKLDEGVVLTDFGNHPSYRKPPFTTPSNKEITTFGRDWNDDSAKGEEPFGKKIGSSMPYDELVNILTDAIMDKMDIKTLKKKS